MYRRLRNADRSRLRGAAATVILVILCCTNPTPPPDQAAILSMVTQDTSLSIYDTLRIPVIAIDFNEKIAAYNLTIDSVNVKGMTGTFISVSFTDTGKHTVSVEAIDTRGGKSLPVTINVRVFASPPAARISLIDTGSVNTTITAESHASDADGKTTAFLWAVDSAVFDTSADSTRQFVWKPDDYGIHTIYSKVIDDDRLVSECDSATIFIHEYRPVIQALADTVVSVNDSFNIDVTASDTNGSVIGYVWRRGISAPETTSLPRLRLLYPSDSAGPDTIRVYALDNDGIRSGTDTIIVDVHSYVPFVIPIADTVVAVFDTAYLHATAKDTNGTVTALLWSMDKIKWDTLPPSRSWNVFFPDSAYGIKTVFARAFDDDSLVSPIDSFNLDVRLYRPLIKAMDDTNVATNDTVLLHASASDTNGEIRRYVWTRLDGHRDTITGSLTKAFFTRNDTGVSLFTVCAFDDDSLASPVDTISVNVHLYRPTVVAMADTDVAINDTITLHASASDTNGSIKGYIWIRPDGHRDTSGNIFKTLFPQKDTGAWIFKVAAIDDDTMASPEDSVRVTVHLYRPDVSIRGDTIFSMYDTVTIGAEGLDTNGTILHYCWSTGN